MNVELHDLYIDALFHVIDVDTSYNALLRWPWLHTRKAIASPLQQCLKYTNDHGNEKTIHEDVNPFHGEDINYTNANFYKSADFITSQVLLGQKGGNQKESPRLLLCLKRSFRLSIVMLVKLRIINP